MEDGINKGDLFYILIDGAVGSEQKGYRPAVIVQNNIGNQFSPTTIIVPLTKKINNKPNLPTHIILEASNYIEYDSVVLTEQIRTIDKSRLKEKIGHIDKDTMNLIDKKIEIALGIKNLK